MEEIENIKETISKCERCDLSNNRKNTVPGEGSKDADIMIIGEAPGKKEDETGRPFVGRAGKVLTEALEKAGIKRSDVFITNVVKCRPPKNRNPKKDEIKKCRGYLEDQLETIEPNIIVPLGNSALKTLLGQQRISEKRGEIFEKDGRKYMPTYHPAATIYNRKLRPELIKDLEKIGEESR